jgi:hypothetical protein
MKEIDKSDELHKKQPVLKGPHTELAKNAEKERLFFAAERAGKKGHFLLSKTVQLALSR